MKKAWGALLLGIVVVLLLSGCKYASLEEAITKDIPFNVNEIIHIEKVEQGSVVFYKTKQEVDSRKVEALAAAFIRKDEEGWENAGHNHWTFYEDDNMMVYTETFHIYKPDGTLDVKIPVVFGRINNNEIDKVQAAKKEEEFIEIKQVKKEKERFFFAIEEYSVIRGLGKDGKEIDRQTEQDGLF